MYCSDMFSAFYLAFIVCGSLVQSFPDVSTTHRMPPSNRRRAPDPEVHMTVPEIISYEGYPAEVHQVETLDHYVLTLHRIPYGRNGKHNGSRPVAFLQHGLLCSSSNWVTNLYNESLGFLLADAGYDVWLGNIRGNDYSKINTKYPTDSDEFWDFSWDEHAQIDLPTMIDYTLKTTGQKQLHYIGHSQGTMMGFAEFPRNPALASKIKGFYALGPVTTVGYIESPIRYLSYFVKEVEFLFDILGVRDFLPNSALIKWLADHVCKDTETRFLCSNIIFVLCGYDKTQLNMTRLDVYMSHTPAGTSVRNVVHYAQMVRSKKFQMYDFGKKENMEKYHQETPPLYNVSTMQIPVALFWAGNDWLADPTDVNKSLIPNLQKKYLIHNQEIKEWDHLDFIWGMDAPKLIYYEIIRLMKDIEEGKVQV